jgi:hypothetical protein
LQPKTFSLPKQPVQLPLFLLTSLLLRAVVVLEVAEAVAVALVDINPKPRKLCLMVFHIPLL